jgi:hypothetical protein
MPLNPAFELHGPLGDELAVGAESEGLPDIAETMVRAQGVAQTVS